MIKHPLFLFLYNSIPHPTKKIQIITKKKNKKKNHYVITSYF